MGVDSTWTDKYLGSDHHADRLVRTVVNYERQTGLQYPEPVHSPPSSNMRLYGDVSDDRVFLPSRRRAYSVGADSGDDDYSTPGIFPVSREALRVTSHAIDDGDLLSAASSRKDRNLMKDITSKMEAVQYGRPIPNELGRRSYRTVNGGSAAVRTVTPRATFGYISPWVARRASVASCVPPSSALRYARALSVQPRRSFLEDDYEEYTLPPQRHVRASSVQPIHTYVDDNYEHYTPSPYTRPYSHYVRARSVGPSRTYLDDDYDYHTPSYYTPPARHVRARSVQPRRTYLDDLTADDYVDYTKSPYILPPSRRIYNEQRYRSRATSEPPVVPLRALASEFAVKQARNRLSHYEPVSLPPSTIRSSSLPRAGSRPIIAPHGMSAAGRARLAALEAKYDSSMDSYEMPTASLGTIRSQTTDIRNRMDTQRSLLDRYLPVYLGPEAEVEDNIMHKYSELVERMPSLDPYRPVSGHGSGSATPTKRTPASGSTYMGPSYRPQVSDVRKRVRQVLCRTKGDPRYFDY